MVWLPDLHPRNVVALNRKALQAVFSTRPSEVREGRRVLSELTRHRLPLEERFGDGDQLTMQMRLNVSRQSCAMKCDKNERSGVNPDT